jgi:hypothetical protein
MVSYFELETLREIWNNKWGTKVEVGTDRDGLGLLEIRQFGDTGKLESSMTFVPEQVPLLVQAIQGWMRDTTTEGL